MFHFKTKTKIKVFSIMLSSILLASCTDATDNQSQNNATIQDSIVTKSSGPTVALSSKNVNAAIGDTFALDINMSNFPTSEGGGVTVQFDASMLNVTDVSINANAWDFVNKIESIDNDSGLISNILFSSFTGVSEDNVIATITFSAISTGNSQISLEASSINPFSSNGEKVAASFVDTNIEITAATVN